MPPMGSYSNALARLLLIRNGALDSRILRSSTSFGRCERFYGTRCLSSDKLVDCGKVTVQSIGNLHCRYQRRSFLGVGDCEGDALSKTYEERRVLGYSPEQLFAVVSAVHLYEDFVPWCQKSKILKQTSDGTFDAELEIGFEFLVESYVSHVELKKPSYIKTTASESGLFDHLINIWKFNPGPTPGTCDLYFFVDFKFQSPLYRQAASVFFKEVVSRLVSSFDDRCHRIYGPGVKVLETAYGQGR